MKTIYTLPRPKVRMTGRSKYTKSAIQCLAYQREIAWSAKALNLPRFPDGYLGLTVNFFVPKFHADLDNLVKAFLDGLQYGGIFKNDRQFVEIAAKQFIDKEEPRIEFEIEGVQR